MPPEPTERLWLTEPARATCLARVVDVRGGAFRVDRCLYRPKSRGYRHPQRADRGTAWVKGGDKHRVHSVVWRGDDPWLRVSGERPDVGAELQCHLDRRRRELDSRAHTAMHLFLGAAQQISAPKLGTDPEVKGGGHFRIELAEPHVRPDQLAAWLERANQWIAADVPVGARYVERTDAERDATPQPFLDGETVPGPDTSLRVVDVPGVCCYPCDGTHVERTSDVGRVVIVEAHSDGRGGLVVVGRVGGARGA